MPSNDKFPCLPSEGAVVASKNLTYNMGGELLGESEMVITIRTTKAARLRLRLRMFMCRLFLRMAFWCVRSDVSFHYETVEETDE